MIFNHLVVPRFMNVAMKRHVSQEIRGVRFAKANDVEKLRWKRCPEDGAFTRYPLVQGRYSSNLSHQSSVLVTPPYTVMRMAESAESMYFSSGGYYSQRHLATRIIVMELLPPCAEGSLLFNKYHHDIVLAKDVDMSPVWQTWEYESPRT